MKTTSTSYSDFVLGVLFLLTHPKTMLRRFYEIWVAGVLQPRLVALPTDQNIDAKSPVNARS